MKGTSPCSVWNQLITTTQTIISDHAQKIQAANRRQELTTVETNQFASGRWTVTCECGESFSLADSHAHAQVCGGPSTPITGRRNRNESEIEISDMEAEDERSKIENLAYRVRGSCLCCSFWGGEGAASNAQQIRHGPA